MKIFSLLALSLLLTSELVQAAPSCKSILGPLAYKFSNTTRLAHLIGVSGQNSALIRNYEPHIRPNRFQPHSRLQCMGTCYAYSSLVNLENLLKLQGNIPADALVLSGPVLGQIARQRFSEKDSLNFSSQELLNGGLSALLHNLNNRRIYYMSASEVLKFGTSKNALEAEHLFLELFVNQESISFNGKKFREHLIGSPLTIGRILNQAWRAYVLDQFKIELPEHYVQIGNLEYEFSRVFSGVNVYGRVSTKYEVAEKDVFKEAQIALGQNPPLPNAAFRVYQPDANETLTNFVNKIKTGHFVKVDLGAQIFGDAHAVTLTNNVIHQETGEVLGFVFLNSHGDFGESGYGFIHAQELINHIIGYEIILSVETN